MSGKTRMAIFVHGGGWIQGSPDDMEPFAERFRAAGWRTRSLDYPLWPDADVEAQSLYVRRRLRAIRVWNPITTIVAIGGSAGGQMVLANTDHIDAAIGLNPALNTCSVGPPFQEAMNGKCEDQYPGPPRCPVLLIHGQDDDLVPIEFSRQYNRQFAPVLLREREGVGHGWFNGVPDEISQEMLSWLG